MNPPKLSPAQVLEIGRRWEQRPTLKSLAAEYGVPESNISRAIGDRYFRLLRKEAKKKVAT